MGLQIHGSALRCAALAATEAGARSYRQSFDEAMSAFDAAEGLRTAIRLEYRNVSRSRVSRAEKWVVDRGSRTLSANYEVYTLRRDDLLLEVHDRAVLEEDDWDARVKTVTCAVPGAVTMRIDGQEAVVDPGESLGFEEIVIVADGYSFRCTGPGRLAAQESALTIDLLASSD